MCVCVGVTCRLRADNIDTAAAVVDGANHLTLLCETLETIFRHGLKSMPHTTHTHTHPHITCMCKPIPLPLPLPPHTPSQSPTLGLVSTSKTIGPGLNHFKTTTLIKSSYNTHTTHTHTPHIKHTLHTMHPHTSHQAHPSYHAPTLLTQHTSAI